MSFRSKVLVSHKSTKNVLYIMSRDQRLHYNYSLSLAYDISHKNKSQLILGCEYFNLKMNHRQKLFVLQGLKKLEQEAVKYNLYFKLLEKNKLKKFVKENDIDTFVVDFNPLREYQQRVGELTKFCKTQKIQLIQVDAHNLVPCRQLEIYKRTSHSVKLQLLKYWNEYFEQLEETKKHKYNKKQNFNNNYDELEKQIQKERDDTVRNLHNKEKYASEYFLK